MAFSDDLKVLEQRLLDPALRMDEAFLTRVLADDYQEIGQSGRVYDKASTISKLAVASGFSGTRMITDFEAREVGPGLVLAIYRITETGTARSSLWRRVASEWELVFNQGTRPSQT